jgi:hypothetical protein
MRHNCFRSMININDFPSSAVARRCSRWRSRYFRLAAHSAP